jgi:hypothetical protein
MATRGRRVRWLVGASAIAVTVGIGLGTGAFGSGESAAATKQAPPRSTAATPHKIAPATSLSKEVLEATYVESGTGGASLPADTYVAIDAIHKITCPAPAGKTCTFTDTVSIQEGDGPDDTNNYIAAPWEVDGNDAGESGPFFASAPTDGGYAGGTWTDAEYNLAPGKHKVQTFAFSVDGANLENWTITYNVYEP